MLVEAISNCPEGLVALENVEAFGILEDLSWIKQKHWTNVIMETDSPLCVQALRSNAQFPSYFGRIISNCIEIRRELNNVFLLFVKR